MVSAGSSRAQLREPPWLRAGRGVCRCSGGGKTRLPFGTPPDPTLPIGTAGGRAPAAVTASAGVWRRGACGGIGGVSEDSDRAAGAWCNCDALGRRVAGMLLCCMLVASHGRSIAAEARIRRWPWRAAVCGEGGHSWGQEDGSKGGRSSGRSSSWRPSSTCSWTFVHELPGRLPTWNWHCRAQREGACFSFRVVFGRWGVRASPAPPVVPWGVLPWSAGFLPLSAGFLRRWDFRPCFLCGGACCARPPLAPSFVLQSAGVRYAQPGLKS